MNVKYTKLKVLYFSEFFSYLTMYKLCFFFCIEHFYGLVELLTIDNFLLIKFYNRNWMNFCNWTTVRSMRSLPWCVVNYPNRTEQRWEHLWCWMSTHVMCWLNLMLMVRKLWFFKLRMDHDPKIFPPFHWAFPEKKYIRLMLKIQTLVEPLDFDIFNFWHTPLDFHRLFFPSNLH